MRQLSVAIVGSGPSGVYCAQLLAEHEDDGIRFDVDVLDKLPVPYGLVRYGVAPDHQAIKSVITTLEAVFGHVRVRFAGNVEVGRDLSMEELRAMYDIVVVATGCSVDRRLDLPGEDLPGVRSAAEFVSWYSGHPDATATFDLRSKHVAVVGAGNVALDVARMLAKTPAELRSTDVPSGVLDAFAASEITDIHILARRGPAHVKFSSKELAELGKLADADIVIRDADLSLDPDTASMVASNAISRRLINTLRELAALPHRSASRRIHLRFGAAPVAVLGDDVVSGLRIREVRTDHRGAAAPTGGISELPCDLVIRSVGYLGSAVPGFPFDETIGGIPHVAGRVVDAAGPLTGAYVVGWAKRGPSGVIGTNRRDAVETVATILADLQAESASRHNAGAGHRNAELDDALARRGIRPVEWSGWLSIDSAEREHGRSSGRDRVKIPDRAELLRIASSSARS